MDLLARVKAELHRGQAGFLTIELATCSRDAGLASTMYKGGNRKGADQKTADAENGYVTVLRFLSDPQCAKHLTIKAAQEFKEKLGVLRHTLDGLQRFQKERLPE